MRVVFVTVLFHAADWNDLAELFEASTGSCGWVAEAPGGEGLCVNTESRPHGTLEKKEGCGFVEQHILKEIRHL